MKKIVRFVSALLLLSLLLLPLGSCHSSISHKAFEIPETLDMTREYEISFWAKNENNENQRAELRKREPYAVFLKNYKKREPFPGEMHPDI